MGSFLQRPSLSQCPVALTTGTLLEQSSRSKTKASTQNIADVAVTDGTDVTDVTDVVAQDMNFSYRTPRTIGSGSAEALGRAASTERSSGIGCKAFSIVRKPRKVE